MESKMRKSAGILMIVVMVMGCVTYSSPRYEVDARNFSDWGKHLRDAKTLSVAILPFVNRENPYNPDDFFLFGSMGRSAVSGKVMDFKPELNRFFVNGMIEDIWKKNALTIAKKDKIFSAFQKLSVKANYIDPTAESVDKNMLASLGREIGADYLVLGTSRENIEAGMSGACCCFDPVSSVNNTSETGNRRLFIGIQIAVFDVVKGDFLVHHAYNLRGQQVNNIKTARGKFPLHIKQFVIDVPMASDEALAKRAASKAASFLTNLAFAFTVGRVIPFDFDFDFSWEETDETWKTYPEGYFMKTYGYTPEDYARI
jgi:hypothetical protein